MEIRWFGGGTIAASGTVNAEVPVRLVRARTFTVTVGVTFGAQATGDARVDVYTSPNGVDWDTIVYTSFDLAVSAGEYIQRTVNIDPPEHGWISIRIVNEDASVAITNYKAWYSVSSHLQDIDWELIHRGEITTKTEVD